MTAYLAAFFAAMSVVVGALILLMVGYLTHATWLVPMRRAVEALASTAPLFLLLYGPIAFSIPAIYPWMRPWTVVDPAARASLEHAHAWFAPIFFVARAYGYMLVWTFFALALRRASLTQDRSSLPASDRRQRVLSAVGLPLVVLTITFAGFDWLMSLEPGWTSDALGLYLGAGAFAGAVGAVCVLLCVAVRAGFLAPSSVTPDQVHALGRVLLMAVLLWAYIGVCQFLLFWIADLPSEVSFYGDRETGGWGWVSGALVVTHFAIPFLALLSRPLKRRLIPLACVGALVVAAHALDAMWVVIPFSGRPLGALDLAPMGGALVLLFAAAGFVYRAAPPVPLRDPDLGAAMEYQSL
jgi:hypothetical protein